MSTTLQNIIDKQNAIKAEMQEHGKSALKEAFAEFFAKHPEVVAIFWYQYTPWFNDGDECVFSVHELELELTEEFCRTAGIEYHKPNYEDRYVEGIGKYTLHPYDYATKSYSMKPGCADLYEDLSDLQAASQELEDLFKMTFGDHAFVLATRDGFKVDKHEHE